MRFELYTLAVFVLAVAFLRARGLRVDWQTIDYTFGPFLPAAPRFLLLGVALQIGYHALFAPGGGARRKEAADYLRRVVTLPWLVLWARLFVAYALFNYVYFWIKVCVPLLNRSLWDPLLWRVDRWLHLGLSPSVLAAELFEGSFLLSWLDRWYGVWILTVMGTIVFFAASPRQDLRRSFLLSCSLLWTLGAAIYLAVPAVGPAYTDPDVFAPVIEELPRAAGGQAALWENYQRMVAGRDGQLYAFNPTRGVAALPSLHVGAHVLFFLWARRFTPPLSPLFLVASVLTFLGSLVTGWHYAVDGYAGAALAVLAYWAARRLEPVEETPGPHAPADDRAPASSGDAAGCSEDAPRSHRPIAGHGGGDLPPGNARPGRGPAASRSVPWTEGPMGHR
jgi:hypothetical protein